MNISYEKKLKQTTEPTFNEICETRTLKIDGLDYSATSIAFGIVGAILSPELILEVVTKLFGG